MTIIINGKLFLSKIISIVHRIKLLLKPKRGVVGFHYITSPVFHSVILEEAPHGNLASFKRRKR